MGLRGEQRSGGRDRCIDRERDLEIEEMEVMKEREEERQSQTDNRLERGPEDLGTCAQGSERQMA